MRQVLTKRLTLRGFIVFDFASQQPEFLAEVGPLVRDGRIKYREDIVDGLEKAPRALIGLLRGENFGKVIVRVTSEDSAGLSEDRPMQIDCGTDCQSVLRSLGSDSPQRSALRICAPKAIARITAKARRLRFQRIRPRR